MGRARPHAGGPCPRALSALAAFLLAIAFGLASGYLDAAFIVIK